MVGLTRTLQRSSAGGEISPEMYGRLDLDKYQTGLALARNFLILPHGPAQNRPGSRMVNEIKDSDNTARVIPFIYSSTQAIALELGNLTMRFHVNGATLLEAPLLITGLSQAAIGVITSAGHGYANDDWVYPIGITGPTDLNGRFYKVANATINTFTLKGLDGADISTLALPPYVGNGTVARVYTIATPYLSADLLKLEYTQSADVLTITYPGYATRELRRLGPTNWTLTVVPFAPALTAPTNGMVVATGGGTVKYEYVVTSVDAAGVEESYAGPVAVSTVNVMAITKANPGLITTGAAHGLVAGDRCYIAAVGGMLELADDVYLVNSAPTATTLTLKKISTGIAVDTLAFTTYTTGGTVKEIEIPNALTTSGNKNTISWTAVLGAARYNVYKLRNGLYGYIGQTVAVTFDDDNIAADVLRTPPEAANANPFKLAGDWPGAVGYYSQRRIFGGTDNRPQNGWMTKPGSENNLTASIPTQDDDSISFRIVSGQQNRILHIVPLADLLFFTPGVEWRMVTQNSDALTPGSFDIKPQSYVGCNYVKPIVTSSSVLFVQRSGTRLREMAYSWEQNQYSAADISIMAPHLFDGFAIVDMAYQTSPYQIAWCVRDDGTLLGLTYVPEHKISAWHQHVTTNGAFESVCVIPEGNEDAVYVVVRRTIGARTVRFIERLASRRYDTLADAFFVDCGLTYSGGAKKVIKGLWHLEGQKVSILADGGVVAPQLVSGGQITLSVAASKVQIGLNLVADMMTLPLIIDNAPAFGTGLLKNVSQAFIRVRQTGGLKVGPTFDKLTEIKARSTENYDSPPSLRDGVIPLKIGNSWSQDGNLCIRQDQPLPATIVSIGKEVAVA